MRTRLSPFIFIIAPPFLVLLAGFVAVTPALRAQFDFGRIKRGIDQIKSTTQKVTDTTKKVKDTSKDVAKIAKGVFGIGPEEERLIGESVAMEIIGKHGGVLRDEEVTRRVNMLGQALAHYSTRPALPWKFAVLDSEAVNGFSAPGGFVFITRGLYQQVSGSDDALAAVLAHEITHVTERHALKIIARGDFVAGTSKLAIEHSQDAAWVQSQLREFDTGIADLAKTILEKGFDPKTEYSADKGGRGLAVTVGYAPGALRQVLVQLQKVKGDPKLMYSTHPSLVDRINHLPKDPPQPGS